MSYVDQRRNEIRLIIRISGFKYEREQRHIMMIYGGLEMKERRWGSCLTGGAGVGGPEKISY